MTPPASERQIADASIFFHRSTQRAKGDAIWRPYLLPVDGDCARASQWEAFFARTGIQPLRITYERFLEDRSGHVGRIANLVGVENPVIDERRIDLAMQRDAVTEEWRQRFRAENGDPNVLDELSPVWRTLMEKAGRVLRRAGLAKVKAYP